MNSLLVACGAILLALGVAGFVKEASSIATGLPPDMSGIAVLISFLFLGGLVILGYGLISNGAPGKPTGAM